MTDKYHVIYTDRKRRVMANKYRIFLLRGRTVLVPNILSGRKKDERQDVHSQADKGPPGPDRI